MHNAKIVPCDYAECAVAGTEHHHLLIDEQETIHRLSALNCHDAMCRTLVDQSEKTNAIRDDIAKEAMEIADWWVKQAMDDAGRTVPKAVEYGAVDFDLMGTFMVALLGDKLAGADAEEKMRVGREMAVVFYMIGKMGRAIGAYAQGVLPSDDTLYDTSVYAMMLRRIRKTGTWVNG